MYRSIMILTASTLTACVADFDVVNDLETERHYSDEPTIAEIAVANPDFSTLVAALDAADLVPVFLEPGRYTVFAPTNDAFDDAFAALGIAPADLLADTETLTDILLYHVTAGRQSARRLARRDEIPMLNGAFADISIDGNGAFINDSAIIATDIQASNGVIHVIDAVLLPPPADEGSDDDSSDDDSSASDDDSSDSRSDDDSSS